eukprot:5405777-Prymnesium_polylepis.1
MAFLRGPYAPLSGTPPRAAPPRRRCPPHPPHESPFSPTARYPGVGSAPGTLSHAPSNHDGARGRSRGCT